MPLHRTKAYEGNTNTNNVILDLTLNISTAVYSYFGHAHLQDKSFYAEMNNFGGIHSSCRQ